MSYEILYRKAVVELPNGNIVSMVEEWSNNCRATSGGRSRSRHARKKMINVSKQDIHNICKSRIQRSIDRADDEITEANRLE